MHNPRLKTTLPFSIFGYDLKLDVPHDVFSTLRIDEGTILLLDHLATATPLTILDMGCGYGALGLPIAAKFKEAKIEMVDRDLLASAYSEKNAIKNGLANVRAYGSLGYENLKSKTEKYDWILCNIPARIGRPFIENFIREGLAKLNTAGDLRIVVINDLNETISLLDQECGFQSQKIVHGPRHSVFAYQKIELPEKTLDEDALYLRDHVTFQGVEYARPFDLGGDDPKRLQAGLPLLIDALPRSKPSEKLGPILCFRSGYGILPNICAKRYPGIPVVTLERDLLASKFIQRNLEENLPEIREVAELKDGLPSSEHFSLVAGEISPGGGEEVCHDELQSLYQALAPGAEMIILVFEKLYKTWIKTFSEKFKIPHTLVIQREGYVTFRISKPKA